MPVLPASPPSQPLLSTPSQPAPPQTEMAAPSQTTVEMATPSETAAEMPAPPQTAPEMPTPSQTAPEMPAPPTSQVEWTAASSDVTNPELYTLFLPTENTAPEQVDVLSQAVNSMGNIFPTSGPVSNNRGRGRGGRGRGRGSKSLNRINFENLASNVNSSFIKFPSPLQVTQLKSLHCHLNSHFLPLIELTKTKFEDFILNFQNQSKLLVASILHNYSSTSVINQVELGNETSFNCMFEQIENFSETLPFAYTPPFSSK